MNNNRKYSNGTITVVWQPAECIHAGVCFRSLRRVFDPVRRPWIDLSAAETEEIIDIIEQCPSQALTFFWNDPERTIAGKKHSHKLFDTTHLGRLFSAPAAEQKIGGTIPVSAGETTVLFREGQPLTISGNFRIIDWTGKEIGERGLNRRAVFCRCGRSENQPFCDGSHIESGFRK